MASKFRAGSVTSILFFLALGGVLSLFIFCEQWHSWSRESMLSGAPLAYNLQKGVPRTWPSRRPRCPYTTTDSRKEWYQHLEANKSTTNTPLENGQLTMFTGNEFNPTCCPSTYMSSSGCNCMTVEQAKYLNARGGNRDPGGKVAAPTLSEY